jgi:hypothetical protein
MAFPQTITRRAGDRALATISEAQQNDPIWPHELDYHPKTVAAHIDSSLFVMSRALGKVAASPPLFSGCRAGYGAVPPV